MPATAGRRPGRLPRCRASLLPHPAEVASVPPAGPAPSAHRVLAPDQFGRGRGGEWCGGRGVMAPKDVRTLKPAGGERSGLPGRLSGPDALRVGRGRRDRAVVDGASLLGALQQSVCDPLLQGVAYHRDLGLALRVGLGQSGGDFSGGLRFPLGGEVSGDQLTPRRIARALGRCPSVGGSSLVSLGLLLAAPFGEAVLLLGLRAAGTAATLRSLLFRTTGFVEPPPSTSCILTRICSPVSSWTSASCRRVNSARARSCSLRFAARSSVILCA